MKTDGNRNQLASILPLLAALTGMGSAWALTPAEQADLFHERGKAAAERGEEECAARCFTLALRATPGHQAAAKDLQLLREASAKGPIGSDAMEEALRKVIKQRGDKPTSAAKQPATAAPPPTKPTAAKPQPVPAPKPVAVPAAGPVWRSKDGKSVAGEFVGLDGEAVVIRRDGKEYTIPFAKLAPASVQQAKDLAAALEDVLPGQSP